MNFIKQIGIEMRNILRSRFLLVITIIVLAFGALSPVGALLISKINTNGGGGIVHPIMYAMSAKAYSVYDGKVIGGGDPSMPPIDVNGVTITSDSPFYWQVQNLQQMKASNEINKANFKTPQSLDLTQGLIDEQLAFYARVAQYITTSMDYRNDLVWNGQDNLFDKYIFDKLAAGSTTDDLIDALNFSGRGSDPDAFKKKYVDIDAATRQAAYDKADQSLQKLYSIIESNDFAQYIDLRIEQCNQQITDMQTLIDSTQKQIIDNPGQEDILNQTIEQYKKQIQSIQTNQIPLLQYRLQKNIIPGVDSWQNNALNDVDSSRSQLIYLTVQTEEQYNKDLGLVQQYGSYRKYVDDMNRQIKQWNNTLLIAQKSLDADKPDMKYVTNGARYKTVAFLDYSVFVALFAVLLGGWMIASEFQQGTIRLLMIRPKTRMKILLAKFSAALGLSLVIYLLGSIVNLVTNGIINGFGDFANPNYTINGSQAFLAYYIPKMLACMLPIVMGFCVAFLLGVLLRNSAVAIVIPVVAFIGCILMTFYVQMHPVALGWIAYTPIPYTWLSAFFTPSSFVQSIIDMNRASLSLPVGIAYLSVLSVVCAVLSVFVFRKRDITN